MLVCKAKGDFPEHLPTKNAEHECSLEQNNSSQLYFN